MLRTRWRALLVVAVLTAALSACSTTGTAPTPVPTAPPTAVAVPEASVLDGLSLEQRVGQVFMVGTSARVAEGVTISAVHDRFVGSVFLAGRSQAGDRKSVV